MKEIKLHKKTCEDCIHRSVCITRDNFDKAQQESRLNSNLVTFSKHFKSIYQAVNENLAPICMDYIWREEILPSKK